MSGNIQKPARAATQGSAESAQKSNLMSCNAAYARCTLAQFSACLMVGCSLRSAAILSPSATSSSPPSEDALVVEPAGGVDLVVGDVSQLLADQLLGAQNIAVQNKTPAAACRGNRGLSIDWIAFS